MTTRPLNCNELVELVTAYLDGTLDLDERALGVGVRVLANIVERAGEFS